MNEFSRFSESPRKSEREILAESNRKIVLDALQEHLWNLGTAQSIEGSVETKRAAVLKMANDALAVAPKRYETLSSKELKENMSYFVADTAQVYLDSKQDKQGRGRADQAA